MKKNSIFLLFFVYVAIDEAQSTLSTIVDIKCHVSTVNDHVNVIIVNVSQKSYLTNFISLGIQLSAKHCKDLKSLRFEGLLFNILLMECLDPTKIIKLMMSVQ